MDAIYIDSPKQSAQRIIKDAKTDNPFGLDKCLLII